MLIHLIPIISQFQILIPINNIPDEIISWGLHNPWKFSFDRRTGDLWIGDISQNSFEEVDFVPYLNFEGRNFG